MPVFKKPNTYLKDILDELFLECEHGDAEHRQWLKDKFEDFRKRKEAEPMRGFKFTQEEWDKLGSVSCGF